jgi:hypothetical protein
MPEFIDIERIESWPSDIRLAFEDNFEVLQRYEAERVRLFELRERDWFASQREGENRHASARQSIIEEVEALAGPLDISSFHCTRLCADEIENIRRDGMLPSSPQFLTERINARMAAGDLSEAIAERLRAKNMATDENRRGMIWFVSGASILREDESGLYRLFRYWGGEALYGLYERDEEVASILQQLGQPCIVAASLPIANYQPFFLGRALYAAFMKSRGIRADRSTGAEGNIKMPVLAERILSIVTFADPEFEKLTGCSSWHMKVA